MTETITIQLLDRDLTTREWQQYMKKHTKTHRITRDELGINQIKCKFGVIQPYSIVNKQLCFIGDFRSKQHLTWFQKKLVDKNVTVAQLGDQDIVVVFHERDLHLLSSVFRCYQRKKLSEQQRRMFADRMKEIRKLRGVTK